VHVAQLSDNSDGVQAGILSERRGDDFEGFGKGLEAVSLHASDGLAVVHQSLRYFDLGGTASGNERLLLNETADDTESVVQGSVGLFQNQVVGAVDDDGDGLARVLDARELDDAGANRLNLLDEFGIAKLLLRKVVNVRNGLASSRLADELDLFSLNVLDGHDLQLGQKVQGQVVHGVSEDALLDQEDVAARLFDLLADIQQVLALFLENLVHLAVVVDNDLVLHLKRQQATVNVDLNYIRLGRRQLELHESNLCLFHARRASSGLERILGQHEAIDEMRVINGSTELLNKSDILQINVGSRGRVNNTKDRVDGNGRQ
jgi:hypothetical protein